MSDDHDRQLIERGGKPMSPVHQYPSIYRSLIVLLSKLPVSHIRTELINSIDKLRQNVIYARCSCQRTQSSNLQGDFRPL